MYQLYSYHITLHYNSKALKFYKKSSGVKWRAKEKDT